MSNAEIQAIEALKSPCDASRLLEIARALNVPGVLVKKYKREELREYALPGGWVNTRIRAVPELHFVG